jgi:hypothetical protein
MDDNQQDGEMIELHNPAMDAAVCSMTAAEDI